MDSNKMFLFLRPKALSLKDRVGYIESVLSLYRDWTTTDEIYIAGRTFKYKDEKDINGFILDYISSPISNQFNKVISPDYIDDVGSLITIKVGQSKLKFSIGGNDNNIPNTLIVERLEERPSSQKKILRELIEYLNPLWATISKYEVYNDIIGQGDDEFRIGWLNYISSTYNLPVIPHIYNIEQLKNGILFEVISSEPFDETNKEYLKKVQSLVFLFRANELKWR